MKKFLNILLTGYVTIVTLAAALFGTLYFTGHSFGDKNNSGNEGLKISVIRTVVDDFITAMNGPSQSNQSNQTSSVRVAYADENNDYNVEQYYSNIEETTFSKEDDVYKGLVYTNLMCAEMIKLAVDTANDYDVVYYDHADTIGAYTNYNVYYTLEKITNSKSRVCLYTVYTYDSSDCHDSLEFVIDKGDETYDYVIEFKGVWGTSSQLTYLKLAKNKNGGLYDLSFCNYVNVAFNTNIDTILNKSEVIEEDLGATCEGGLYNFNTMKAKVGEKTHVLNAVNGLRNYVSEFNYLKNKPSQVKTNYCEGYEQLMTTS